MCEQIFATAVWRDKSETLGIVEPFHCTGRHGALSEKLALICRLIGEVSTYLSVPRTPGNGEFRSSIVASLSNRHRKFMRQLGAAQFINEMRVKRQHIGALAEALRRQWTVPPPIRR